MLQQFATYINIRKDLSISYVYVYVGAHTSNINEDCYCWCCAATMKWSSGAAALAHQGAQSTSS